jgi:hypothetical protein
MSLVTTVIFRKLKKYEPSNNSVNIKVSVIFLDILGVGTRKIP